MNKAKPIPDSYCADTVALRESGQLVDYADAVDFMESRVMNIAQEREPELIWFLQHPPLYTAGTSANTADLVDAGEFEVYKTGRGGQYTYHGPGQRVVYVMLDLKKRGRDVRALVCALEDWIIETLADFGIAGERRNGRVGVWVIKPDGSEAKIAALGIRIRKWVSFHGISINLNPELSHFEGIVPCGISEHGVTSFKDLGLTTNMAGLDAALQRNFEKRFGPLVTD